MGFRRLSPDRIPVTPRRAEISMPIPQILADIVRLLIQLLPAMALVCLVLAGVALRLEGGSTFQVIRSGAVSQNGSCGASSC